MAAVSSTLNNVRVVTTTTGQGTVTCGAAYSNKCLTEVEANAVDGGTYRYRLDEGNDFEIGTGVYTASTRALTRATVHVSKINGVASTTKMTLTGSATVRFVVSAEDFAQLFDIHAADIASATGAGTLDLDAATGDLVDVTGTTAITAITLADGRERVVRFTGALTLTHGSSLVLPGSANITTVAGDFAIFRGYAAGVVRCVNYQPLGAMPINRGGTAAITAYAAKDNLSIHGADVASATTTNLDTATGDVVDVTGTTTITAITLSEGRERTVRFTGILTLTHGASLVLPTSANIVTAAGDYAVFRGYAGGVVRCVEFSRANGTPVGGALHKVVNATYDLSTASGTQDITGFSFDPKAVDLNFCINGGTFAGVAYADSSGSGGASATTTDNGAYWIRQTGPTIVATNQAVTAYQAGAISFITDGIRITWTKTGSPTGTLGITVKGSR